MMKFEWHKKDLGIEEKKGEIRTLDLVGEFIEADPKVKEVGAVVRMTGDGDDYLLSVYGRPKKNKVMKFKSFEEAEAEFEIYISEVMAEEIEGLKKEIGAHRDFINAMKEHVAKKEGNV